MTKKYKVVWNLCYTDVNSGIDMFVPIAIYLREIDYNVCGFISSDNMARHSNGSIVLKNRYPDRFLFSPSVTVSVFTTMLPIYYFQPNSIVLDHVY